MPGAVAGATLLARELLGEQERAADAEAAGSCEGFVRNRAGAFDPGPVGGLGD
jgi:CysZ protein